MASLCLIGLSWWTWWERERRRMAGVAALALALSPVCACSSMPTAEQARTVADALPVEALLSLVCREDALCEILRLVWAVGRSVLEVLP